MKQGNTWGDLTWTIYVQFKWGMCESPPIIYDYIRMILKRRLPKWVITFIKTDVSI